MKTYLRKLRWGIFNLIEGDMISSIADYTGEWSDVEIELLGGILAEDSNVVEVGSNIGLHSVPLASFIPKGKLICFEPQRLIFQQLCCNLALNNITNAYSYRLGVGHKKQEIQIESTDYAQPWNYGSFSLEKGFSSEGDFGSQVSQEVLTVVSLDSFADVKSLDRLDLLKINAEGMENSVLQGAKKTIKRLRPIIFTEFHQTNADELLTTLHGLGYKTFWAITKRYQEGNFYQAKPQELGLDANLLGIPVERLQAGKEPNLQHLDSILPQAISALELESGNIPFLLK